MYVWENTRATPQPAAQSSPPNSTSMDALVVGLAPKKGASKKKKKKKSSNETHISTEISSNDVSAEGSYFQKNF